MQSDLDIKNPVPWKSIIFRYSLFLFFGQITVMRVIFKEQLKLNSLLSHFSSPFTLIMASVYRHVQSLAPQGCILVVITQMLYFRFLIIIFVALSA